MKTRVDKLLYQLGHFESRKKAQVAISKGLVTLKIKGELKKIHKTSEEYDLEDIQDVKVSEHPELKYVSRAGYKLEGVLQEFAVDCNEKLCLDIGLSTGGFADCLIQRGAKVVFGIDVGRDQLHHRLKNHDKLIWYDKVNAKLGLPEDVLGRLAEYNRSDFDLITVDVSFISVVPIVEAIKSYLNPQGLLVALIKPQFEVGRTQLNRKGLVDKEQGLLVLQKTVKTFEGLNLLVCHTAQAVIEGEDGNQEFFILARSAHNN